MTRLAFFLRTALNNLRRGGQRVLVAVLCVAFGVMSVVAMSLLSEALEGMLLDEPQDLIGADISMDRLSEDVILPEHIEGLETLRAESMLDDYTLVAYSSSLAFHLPGSGEMHFPGAGIGIDPAVYPPVGSLMVESPGNIGLPTLLQETGDVVISRDLALEHRLAVGDIVFLSDLTAGAPLEAHIRGIVIDTPNHHGSKLYYSLGTAVALSGGANPLNTVLATAGDLDTAQSHLQDLGWRVFLATDLAASESQVQEIFSLMLNGAGVLGLLVGGVGIANTMQVLLRRRRREVAVWKTLGYRSGDLLILFSLEAGLLGLVGSLLGAVLGVFVSAGLVDLFSRTSTLLIRWTLSPFPVITAVVVGVVTTVVFALWAIVSASRVVPAALLRGGQSATSSLAWYQGLGLIFILSLPFTAATALVMGSLPQAVGVLIAALAGLVGVGGFLAALLWVITRLLPLRGIPLANMGRMNLRRRGLAPVFSLIALFVGVVTLTLGGVVTLNASRVLESSTLDIQGDNLTLLAPASEAESIGAVLKEQDFEWMAAGYQTQVRDIHLAGDAEESFSPLLIARDEPSDFEIQGEPWGSRPDGVYTPAMSGIPGGSRIEVTMADGTQQSLPVVGTYTVDFSRMLRPEVGVLLPTKLSLSLAPPDQVQYFVRVAPARLNQVSQELGAALPQATLINRVAHAARFTRQYFNLFLLAVSMAGLALLAGVLLMANSVSLAMLDRRYEIGVLKAVGYARWHILLTLMVEYALIALVASGAGLAIVRGFLWLVGMQNELAGNLMVLTPAAAAAIGLATLGLTLITVLAVTWHPTQVSPLVVLNDRA